jgi:(p)ppGpp synthase/HD superfamily hydrolase
MPIEVQIRTEDMHRIAESGIAAHWQYKTGEDSNDAGRAYRDRASEWLQHLMEMPHSGNSAEEFMESVKLDLFPDKVYVFTPRGEIRRLPRNATAVDFAYSVHTDIGNHCVAAKVDRRLVPLRTPLRNGQTVEIITAKGATPNPAWVNFVVTAKARAAIRHYLKGLKHSEAIELGKRMLSQALQDVSLVLKKIPEERLQAVAVELNLKTPDELLEKIGLGERLAALVARRLLPADGSHQPEATTQAEPLAIAGTEGMVVSYARCCFPIPNDPIMAYLSSGRGVVIHREACGNLRNYRKQPDKWLTVTWQPNVDRLFNVEVRIDVANRMGVLAAIASNIATTETNIEHVAVDERDGDASTLIFDLQVRNRKHLAHVIKNLRKMPEVLRVTRVIA